MQLGAHIVGEADYDWSGHSVSLPSDGKTVAVGGPETLVDRKILTVVRGFTNTVVTLPPLVAQVGHREELILMDKPEMTSSAVP